MVTMGNEKESHIHKCQWKDVGPLPTEPFIEFMISIIAQHGDKAALVGIYWSLILSIDLMKKRCVVTWVESIILHSQDDFQQWNGLATSLGIYVLWCVLWFTVMRCVGSTVIFSVLYHYNTRRSPLL